MTLVFAVSPSIAGKPERIVSLGLCSDQLLLILAEPDQIASVSNWAIKSEMSYMADAVGDIPLNHASAEEVIKFNPDLVVASDFVAWDTVKMLRQLGYRVEQVPVATSVDQIYDLLIQFGQWTGNLTRAEATVTAMKQKLREIQERYASRPQKTVIVYSPNGYTPGRGTLENDVLVQAGYRNLAAEMGIDGFKSISLERLVSANPDVLMIDSQLMPSNSLATVQLQHPVIKALVRQREALDIPLTLRICSAPMITQAIEQMAARR